MASIFILTLDVFNHILDIEDKIALAFKCELFRRLCVDEGVFRKLDLSRHQISTTQREVMNKFFMERRLTEHIRELNISNLRMLNWQMDDHLERFIKSICPQLEALHVLDCGVSFQTLQRILLEAVHLTSLSWSIWDFTSEDTEFISKTMKSAEGVCLKNIKHLHLQMNDSLPQIQLAKYLVLSCCRDLEELKICIWKTPQGYCTGGSFPLSENQSIPGLHQPSAAENELNNLNSLVVVPVGGNIYKEQIYNFALSVLSKKSSSTKWKKFCISPTIRNSRRRVSLFLHSDDFQSVEAIGVSDKLYTLDELKTFFASIGDNTVRSLQLRLPDYSDSMHLYLPNCSDSIVELCNPISRVGGHSLKFLSLSFYLVYIPAEQNAFIHTLFSNCSNITELDLFHCRFERDICKPLSELKNLIKVQLLQYAISSKYTNENQVSKANLLTFVENCKKITHLYVSGCWGHDKHFSCLLTNDDLLALAKLRNLRSLTLREIHGITEWTFLTNISENCKFLTTLKIADNGHFNRSHIQILMESSRFLKHLAISLPVVPFLESEVFWNLLRHAKNLERLCIYSTCWKLQNIPVVAVETLRSLPRLHVLHLHDYIQNVDDFYDQLIRMLEEKESDSRFSFEIVTRNRMNTCVVIVSLAGHFVLSCPRQACCQPPRGTKYDMTRLGT